MGWQAVAFKRVWPVDVPDPQLRQGAVLLAGILLLGVALTLMPGGTDWRYHFYAPIQGFWAGTYELYDSSHAFYFANPPWAVLLLTPLALLPVEWGEAGLRMVNVLCLLVVATAYAPPVRHRLGLAALAATSLWTVDLLIAANLSGLVALGILVGLHAGERQRPWLWVAGIALMSFKPQLALFPGFLALLMLREWPRPLLFQAMGGLGLLGLLSFAIGGSDWPTRWAAYLLEGPSHGWLLSTPYRAIEELKLPMAPLLLVALVVCLWVGVQCWRAPRSRAVQLLAVAANAALSPYITGRDLAVQMAACWPTLNARSGWLGLAIYGLSLLPLLRIPFGLAVTWIDSVFSLVLFAGAILYWRTALGLRHPSVRSLDQTMLRHRS